MGSRRTFVWKRLPLKIGSVKWGGLVDKVEVYWVHFLDKERGSLPGV